MIPHTRIVKSFFKFSLFESSISNDSTIIDELFETEKYNIEWLINDKINMQAIDSRINYPNSVFVKDIDAANMKFEESCTIVTEDVRTKDYIMIGGELSRSFVEFPQSSIECCEVCSRHPLCISWNYYIGDEVPIKRGCHLKGSKGVYTYNIHSPGSYSSDIVSYTSSGTRLVKHPAPRAVILHGTSCFYRNESIAYTKRDINDIYIGRYMLERSQFRGGYSNDEYYVAACAAVVESIVAFVNNSIVFFSRWTRCGFQRSGTGLYIVYIYNHL